MCRMRSSYYCQPMPHLFTMKKRVNGIETTHCTWCTKEKK